MPRVVKPFDVECLGSKHYWTVKPTGIPEILGLTCYSSSTHHMILMHAFAFCFPVLLYDVLHAYIFVMFSLCTLLCIVFYVPLMLTYASYVICVHFRTYADVYVMLWTCIMQIYAHTLFLESTPLSFRSYLNRTRPDVGIVTFMDPLHMGILWRLTGTSGP